MVVYRTHNIMAKMGMIRLNKNALVDEDDDVDDDVDDDA